MTIAATDQHVLDAGRRVVARRRWAATAVASVFFAVGWLAAWVCPPVVVALARLCRRGLSWCASAIAVGWADAGKAASTAPGNAAGRGGVSG